MEILSEFNATETFLILGRSHTAFKHLLRYGLLDLLVNRVLEISFEELQPHPNDPIARFYCIGRGPNFDTYKALPHDEVFLQLIRDTRKEKVLLRRLVRAALERAKSQKNFIKNYVLKSPMVASKFKDNWFYRLFRIHKLNPKGLGMQHHMKTELRQLEIELPDLIRENPSKTLETLLTIKGNLFLLRNASATIIPQIKPQFFKEIHRVSPNEAINYGEKDYYWDLLSIYPQFVHEFDRLFTTIAKAIREGEGLSSLY